MEYKVQHLPLSKLALNAGQIEGLPANPRQWTRDDVTRIAKSLTETPELFELRPIIAVSHGKDAVILAGSLRYCGVKENGDKTAPVILLGEDTPVAKMKEIVLKDNGSFGAWDMDALANEWDDLPLADWGVPAWSAHAEDGLPSELDGLDLNPDGLANIDGVDTGENRRVVISYAPEDEEAVAKFLGVDAIDRIIYEWGEIGV